MLAQFLSVVVCLAGQTGPVDPLVIQSAEEKFSGEVSKAESDLAKVRKAAGVVRLSAYKNKLAEYTKAGDFDKATATKARIEQLEAEPEGEPVKGAKKPRPKDTVKFGGHTYALIKEPATWHVAKQRCEEMGGHLVILNGIKEEQFAAKLCGLTTAWIGATDEEEEGKWINVDNTPFTVITHSLFDNSGKAEHWMTWDGVSQHFNDLGPARIAYVCEWDR